MEALVVNLYGGPGTGKSTTAAGVFFLLKSADINCELVTEYAKSKVWENSEKVLDDQLYVFAKQHHRMEILRNKVKVVVTDSPLLLSFIYGSEKSSDSFRGLVWEKYKSWNNMDIFLERVKTYNPSGRMQTLEEAKGIDSMILELFERYNVDHQTVVADKDAHTHIFDLITKFLTKLPTQL